jgi:hypothetical protein
MRIRILLVFLLVEVTTVYGQNIVGKVIDGITLQPIEFANVVLLNKADSSFISGTVTEVDGQFTLSVTDSLNKLIKISYIGYQDDFVIPSSNNVGSIKLNSDTKKLNEVVVKAAIQKVENAGISTNIQATHLKDMGSALDVLGQLPFVYKTGNEIEVFGKGTPLIYINNRLIRDNAELDEVNSSNIKKITVITNPGAEYDGTVNSVIKIETIKTISEGLSGNTSVSTHFDRKFSHSEIQNINYRVKNWDIFGLLRFSESRDLMYQDIYQSVLYGKSFTELEQSVKEKNYYRSFKANAGFNSILGKDNSYGVRYEYTKTPKNESFIDANANVSKNKAPFDEYFSLSNTNAQSENHYVNFYCSGTILPWLSLQFDGDIYAGDTKRNQNVNNHRLDTQELISTNSKQEYELYAGKLKVTSPLLGGKLIYGGEYSYTKNTQFFYVNDKEAKHDIEENSNKANQGLYAAFAIYNRNWGKLSFDLGLRYEDANFDYYDKNGNLESESKRYKNLLPNIALSYSDKKYQMMLSYRSTIYRPSYYQLRNSIQYDGPYTYESGNPYLKPTYKNSLSFLMSWKGFKISSVYSMYENIILFVPEQYKEDIVLFHPLNVDKSQNFSFSLAYSTKVGVWAPSVEAGVSKDFLTYGTIPQDYKNPRFIFKVRNSFSLPYNILASIDAVYSTNGNSNLSYTYSASSVNLYLTKLLFKDKLKINIKGNDIFNTDRKKREMCLGNVETFQDGDQNTRRLTISVVYNFNSTKSKYKGEGATNEINRL